MKVSHRAFTALASPTGFHFFLHGRESLLFERICMGGLVHTTTVLYGLGSATELKITPRLCDGKEALFPK